jgi:quercetin dioxygenase-like cupin family protein
MKSATAFLLLAPIAGAQDLVWAPKKSPDPYTGVHKVHRKYVDLRAAHAKAPEWNEVVVDDDLLKSEWIQRKPGFKTPRMLHPDTRSWWVVLDGEVRFSVEGSEPFVAGKGSMVQAPMTTWHSWEVVGDRPALVFETNIANAATVYSADGDAPKSSGLDFLKMPLTRRPGMYLHKNKPHTTFKELASQLESGALRGTQKVVEDDRGAANFIYGYEKNLAKVNLADRGHFHTDTAEYWLILAGEIRYRVEGFEVFIAQEGDVVYVPRNRWHLARWHGEAPACRLAMNGYPNLMHFYDPEMPVPGNKPIR